MTTQTKTRGSDGAMLGLGSVVIGSLPVTLFTDAAPDRYTVEAVFTRHTDADERNQIHSGDTRQFLVHVGYPTVELTVSDRRLEIANTNLEELRDGLAGMLSERLAAISSDVRSRREAAAMQFQEDADLEHERVSAVAALAESVVFEPAHPGYPRTRAERNAQE